MKLLLFSTLLVGWMTYYLCQRTLPSAMTIMLRVHVNRTPFDKEESDDRSETFSKAFIGQLQSLFAVAYSISFLSSGILSDKINVKVMFSLGLALSGVLLALFPFTAGNHWLGMLVYFCFGISQGCGWPATAKMLRQTYHPSELGLAWGLMSTGSSIATMLSPFVVLFLISTAGRWEFGFNAVGVFSFCLSLLAFVLIGQAANIPDEESSAQSSDTEKDSDGGSETSDSRLQWFHVFRYRELWGVMAMHSILWLVRASVLDWGQLYLIETKAIIYESAGTLHQYISR